MRVPGWACYLVVGALLTVPTAWSHAAWGTWGATLLQASGGVAVVWGIRRYRPRRAAFWWLLAIGQFCYAAAQGSWRIRADGHKVAIPFYDFVDVLYLSAFALFIAALAVGPRRQDPNRSRLAGTIDASAVVLGLSYGTWRLIPEPVLMSDRLDAAGVAIFLGYQGLEMVRIAFFARVVLSDGARTGAQRLMLAGMFLQVAGDIVYGVGLTTPPGPVDSWYNAAWVIGSVLIGAAALHPSMALDTDLERDEPSVSRTRLVLFLLLVGVSPVTTGLQAITGGPGTSAMLVEAVVPMLLGVFVSALMVIRLGMVAAVAHGRTAELETLRDRLAHRATHDPLTGLGNRALITEALASRPGRSTLMLIDLDGFKDVNDAYGHPAGDALLVELAGRLRGSVGFALVARLGGDEFAVMLPTADEAAADETARRIVARIAEPYRFQQWHAAVTASVGLLAIDGPVDPSEALRDADLALYEAKSAGKDQVVRFRPELRAARTVHTTVSAGLRDAVRRAELAVHYQPIIDLATGRITAVEALLRWTPTGGEPVPPGVFIPIAETTGQIGPIGAWVLDRACADARPWYERHGVAVTVNVSGRQFADPDLPDAVLAVLAAHRLPGSALIIEITESVLLGSDRAVAALQVLRRAGVRVAVDDFGTGYSSLSYLRRLPVDILKLDRSLTLASRTRQDEVITRAVLDLGEGLRLPTIAEGVESEEQADALRAMGCPLAQGFHFARPAPADVIDALLGPTGTLDSLLGPASHDRLAAGARAVGADAPGS